MKKRILWLVSVMMTAIFMAFNVTVTNGSLNANLGGLNTFADGPCGYCGDVDPSTGLEFCNMTKNLGQCGGNDGGDCGSVQCS